MAFSEVIQCDSVAPALAFPIPVMEQRLSLNLLAPKEPFQLPVAEAMAVSSLL